MKMVNNALSIGSVFGIPIRLHISLLIAIVLFSLFSGAGLIVSLILAIGLFGSVALHELGHSLVARAKGGYIHEIVLYPFGGAAKIANLPTRPMDEILVALAGPAVSLALGLLGILSRSEFISALGVLNLILCGFNLIPCFPMDGGRVFRAAITPKKGRLEATRLAAKVGKYFCILFVVFGLLQGHLLLALIGGYIYFVGQQELKMVQLEHQANHFSGYGEGNIGVEVSPPPYAGNARSTAFVEKLRSLFRR